MSNSHRLAKKVKGVYEKVTGSGVWWIRYADKSGRIRRELAGPKSDARDLYTKRKAEVLKGKKLPETIRKRAVTFAELADDALEFSRVHKRSYRADKGRMAKLKGAFGSREADSITPQEFDRWLCGQTELKAATLNRYRALFSLTYRLGMQNRKAETNPARLVRQRKENNARIRFLSTEEEQSLRKVVQDRFPQHLPELDLALNTGLRRGEQYGLTWDCIDFERESLTVMGSKNGENRHVPLNASALAALRMAASMKNGNASVFLNYRGEKLSTPREWFEPAVKGAKLQDFTWHCLRHTFASRLVMAGVDLRTVQELMGHKTIHMTVRYAHLAPEHRIAAVQRLCDTASNAKESTDPKTSTSRNGPNQRLEAQQPN